jgi:hypothetical protein
MSTFLKSALLVLLVVGGLGAVHARPLTETEKQDLAKAIATFDAAMRERSYEVIFETVPPRMLESIARQANMPLDALKSVITEQMKAAFEQVKIESHGMDLARARFAELSSGEPYALIPTELVMSSETGRFAARSETLGLLDDGAWYLVRVSDPQQLAILRQVYPGFSTVEFSRGTMEALD